MRKTVDIQWLVETVNQKLALTTISQAAKAQLCCFVEEILMETGNYHGFNYLQWMHNGFEQWQADGEPEDRDPYIGQEFDRFYYYK